MNENNIYDLVSKIPIGSVMTYGQIAKRVGTGPRAVGNVLHNNPDPVNTPCHRVVNSRGEIAVNFAFGGQTGQAELLKKEGIIFQKNGRIDLEKYGFEIR